MVYIALFLFASGFSFAGLINKPFTFQPQTVIKSAEVNQNFDVIYNEFNGRISDVNIATNAFISQNKISNAIRSIDADKVDNWDIHYGTTPFGSGFIIFISTPNPTIFISTGTDLPFREIQVSSSSFAVEASSSNFSLDSSKLNNQLPTYYLNRVNHIGTQAEDTIIFSTMGHKHDGINASPIALSFSTITLSTGIVYQNTDNVTEILYVSYISTASPISGSTATISVGVSSTSLVEVVFAGVPAPPTGMLNGYFNLSAHIPATYYYKVDIAGSEGFKILVVTRYKLGK